MFSIILVTEASTSYIHLSNFWQHQEDFSSSESDAFITPQHILFLLSPIAIYCNLICLSYYKLNITDFSHCEDHHLLKAWSLSFGYALNEETKVERKT